MEPAKVPLRRAEPAAVAAVSASIAMYGAAVVWAGAEQVAAELGRVGPWVCLGLLALSLVNYAARGLRWHLFTRALKLPVPLRRSALYYVAGFAMTPTPGKLGEALRLWLIARGHGCRYRRSAALQIGDQLSDLQAMLLLCLLGAPALAAASHPWALAAAAALLALASWLLLRPALLLRLLLVAYGWVGTRPRLFAGFRVLLRQTASLMARRVYVAALALALLAWLAQCLALYWLLAALDAGVTVQQAVFVFAGATLVGALSFLPGGLGGTEASMVVLLLVLGVEAGTAVTATAVIRLATLWFAVGLGFLALPRALRLVRPAALPPVVAVRQEPGWQRQVSEARPIAGRTD